MPTHSKMNETILQIIQDTYNTKSNFKETVELYGLDLNDVGVTIFSHNPKKFYATILDSYKSNSTIVLFFCKKANKVVGQSISI